MWIGEIDVLDDDLLRRYWEAGREADAHEREYPTFWPYEALEVSFREPANVFEQHPLAAIDGDEVLGTAQTVLPLLDNTHLAYTEPLVRPAHRARGVGTALLRAALDLVRDKGRTTVLCEANLPLADASTAPGRRLLEKHGFRQAILDMHRVLDLPVASATLSGLAPQIDPRHDGYELVTWQDSTPDDLVDAVCTLNAAFNDEAPSGDLDLEAEVWTEQRIREREERNRQQGRHDVCTVALAANGAAAGLTEMVVSDHRPNSAQQGGTLVLPAHRGKRLGMALKVQNLSSFQSRFPTADVVHSWNAEENAHMVAINDALGFRPVELVAEMQLVLDGSARL